MTLYTVPYCSINGIDFSSIVYSQGVEPSGGELGVEEISVPGRDYADIRTKGRVVKKYKVHARSTDRDAIENFLKIVNIAPVNSKFYPYDASRFGLIAASYGVLKAPQPWGAGYNFWEAEAEITCREPWLLGPDKGLAYATWPTLPWYSAALTNTGHARAPIRYLRASGYAVTAGYVEDLSVRITPSTASTFDRSIGLCDKMMRRDLFEFGWAVPGGAQHSYTAHLTDSLAVLGYDVHGNVSGGDLTSGILTLDNSDYIMMPFYGPLPVSGEPGAVSIIAYVTAYSGSRGLVYYATETDLSDMTPIDQDGWKVGWNTIYVPDLAGEGFVAIGIKASPVGSISMSYLKGMVKRYVAPSEIPSADLDESYMVRVGGDAAKCTTLMYGEALVNDRYYY